MQRYWFILLLLVAGCHGEDHNPDIPEGCIDESKKYHGICTMELFPVCGCNGVTYGNKCIATWAGVTSWTQGECP